jgi:type II secretory pathway component GspD/PulD (secretin)
VIRRFVSLGMVALLLTSLPAVGRGATMQRDQCSGPSGVSSSLHTFDFRQLDLRTALYAIGVAENKSVVLDDKVPATDLRGMCLVNTTTDQAYNALFAAFDLASKMLAANIRLIGPADKMAVGSVVPDVAVVPLHGDPSGAIEFAHMLQQMVPGTLVSTDRVAGTMTILGGHDAVARARDLALRSSSVTERPDQSFTTNSIHVLSVKPSDLVGPVRKALGNFSSPNSVTDVDVGNVIVVAGAPDFVARASQIVNALDQPAEIARLDILVVAFTPQNDSVNKGLLFGGFDVQGNPTPGAALIPFTSGTAIKINATLNELQSAGVAFVLSRGSLYAQNNTQAMVSGITTYPFIQTTTGFQTTQTVQTFDTGATVKLTPTIRADSITVDLDATYATLVQFSSNGLPVISKNENKGIVPLKYDEALVISGFFTDISTDTLTKLPILGDLKLIGGLFRNRQGSRIREQVAFVVTPHRGWQPVDAFTNPAQGISDTQGLQRTFQLKLPLFPANPGGH